MNQRPPISLSGVEKSADEKRRRRFSCWALAFFLRAGRITRYSPYWKGFAQLLWLYRRVIPEDFFVRINDFDKDLVLDVNPRGNTEISLWHFPDLYERKEREIFCASITPGCHVLDVGANIGLYTLLGAKRGARVFSIEADPLNAAMLRHHVKINGFNDRVTIFEIAATDCEKLVPLYRHPFNLGESNIVARGWPSGMVEGKSLDALNLPPINVCKMDVEGAELMALKGMENTLRRSPGMKLLVEYNQALGSGEALLDCLRRHFSSLSVIGTSSLTSCSELPPYCNLLAVR